MLKMTLVAAAAVLAVPAAVQAGPGDQDQTIVIKASGAKTAAGARRFQSALRGALDQVCGSYGSSEKDQWLKIEDCRAAAIESVNQQLAASATVTEVRLAAR